MDFTIMGTEGDGEIAVSRDGNYVNISIVTDDDNQETIHLSASDASQLAKMILAMNDGYEV
jgi:pectate lyase